MERIKENETGYLFKEGKIIDFEKIILNNIDYGIETGALRIRATSNEVDVDFISEIKPTKEQLDTIRKLKTDDRKLFFEMINKENKVLKGFGGFNKTIEEMEKQIRSFYD